MTKGREEHAYHDIMKRNILKSPSEGLEDEVMNKIEEMVKSKRTIRTSRILSFGFAIMASVSGILLSIQLSEMMISFNSLSAEKILLFSQAIIVLTVVILFDHLLVLFSKSIVKK